MESEAILFSNGGVHKEFTADDHYAGPARNRPTPSFHVAIDCHEGYIFLVRAGYEEHPNRFGSLKHCRHLILFQLAPNFVKLRWYIAVQAPKIKMCSVRL